MMRDLYYLVHAQPQHWPSHFYIRDKVTEGEMDFQGGHIFFKEKRQGSTLKVLLFLYKKYKNVKLLKIECNTLHK